MQHRDISADSGGAVAECAPDDPGLESSGLNSVECPLEQWTTSKAGEQFVNSLVSRFGAVQKPTPGSAGKEHADLPLPGCRDAGGHESNALAQVGVCTAAIRIATLLRKVCIL